LSRISSFKNSLITVKAYFNDPDLQKQMPWLKSQEWARSIKIMLIVALNQERWILIAKNK
jgi:hypothetical protein